MEEHTLEAVFSMPDDLFYPIGTVTVIIVFKAHAPHPKNYETYFGYWKKDGFVKVKNLGRIDYFGKWKEIRTGWIYNYRNKKEIEEKSVKKIVAPEDEWCAEAYMKTDYSTINKADFENTLRDFVIFKFLNGMTNGKGN